ncbi:MAG: hypothetical protein EPGJADBJ_03978 [Saprospiraceae bacterium]|nr:hypothetical protein [Saprospiraceae bacterium]
MKILHFISAIFLLFEGKSTLSQTSTPGPAQIIVFTELCYKNSKPVYWNSSCKADFTLSKNDKSGRVLDGYLYEKENYSSPSYKGTGIVLQTNKASNDFGNKNSKIIFNIDFYLRLTGGTKKYKARMYELEIDFSKIEKLNSTTYKSNDPIKVASPEIFSLISMMNHLDSMLNQKGTRNGGFRDIIDKFELFRDSTFFFYQCKLTFNDQMNYFKLAEFLEEYIEIGSFFEDEAIKLQTNIVVMDSLLKNDRKIDPSLYGSRKDLEESLQSSKEIHSFFLLTHKRLKILYSQLKSLFSSCECLSNGRFEVQSNLKNKSKPKHEKSLKWRTKLSIGTAFSFGENARSLEYFFIEGDGGTRIINQREINTTLSPGLVIFIHHHYQISKSISAGLMIGPGFSFYSTDKFADAAFYVGGSIAIGKSQALLLGSGIGFLRVNRIKSPQYSVGQILQPSDLFEDVSENVFRPSLFISVSYRLLED